MKTFKDFINESSLSRVFTQTKEHDSGTISAFRSYKDCGNGEQITKSTNKKNSSILKAKLLNKGYGVTKIDGAYIENYGTKNAVEVKEESYIVIDLKDTGKLKKDLLELGQLFDQDSITFQEANGTYYLISSNTCPDGYPGSGKLGVEIKLGKSIFGKDGEFHSKVNGRPFVFESLGNFETKISKYPTEIRSIVETAKLEPIK